VSFLPYVTPPDAGIVPWWSLIPLFCLAEWYALGSRGRSGFGWVSSHEAALVLGLFLAPAWGVLGAQACGVLLATIAAGQRRPRLILRRLRNLALSSCVAIVVFNFAIGLGSAQGWAGWLAATSAAVGAALALYTLTSWPPGRDGIQPVLIVTAVAGTAASIALALVAVELLRESEGAAALLVLPFIFSGLVLRAYVNERRRHDDLRALYASMRLAQSEPGIEAALAELISSTRRLLRADLAWIAMLPRQPSDPTLVAECSQGAAPKLRPAQLSAGEDAAVRAALAARGALTAPAPGLPAFLAERKLSAALFAGLRGPSGVVAVVAVGNVDAPFSREDARLLETYAGEAAVLLEQAQMEKSLSELTALKEALDYQASYDQLTGLPNRALFTKRVGEVLVSGAETGRPAVLFLDLDDFKHVNDSYGHQAGDQLLKAVGERIATSIRPLDIPARLGGDEFAVLARGAREEDAERIAQRLVDALADPYYVEGHTLVVHASVGLAFGTSGGSATEVLRNADVAMYAAKQRGKRRYVRFESQMQERVRSRTELASALERAIQNGEIVVHYQPIVAMGDRRLVGLEALARWVREGHGVIPPAAFIPLADELGLMVDIGRIVLRSACRQTRSWQTTFPGRSDLSVNVNLAPSELLNAQLAQEVEQVLDQSGLAPDCLVLEITEDGVMRNPEEARATMRRLRALGVSLALDDFGTGHSSLAHLREFPIDILKIAKPFVSALHDGQANAAFVETIVQLAATLGQSVVAEGVESAEQAEEVARLGCGFAQGYYFGAPLAGLGVSPYLSALRLPVNGTLDASYAAA
jgi:diguanylate cyclase (GGDEF)-like protein